MYYARIKKIKQYVDPRDLFNFGFLKAIPRIKLQITLNYTTRLNKKHRKREFHIASISGNQIICDYLYETKNGLSDSGALTEKRIIAGIDKHYSKGGIKLDATELIRLVYEKYIPERDLIIDQFKQDWPEYDNLLK